MSQKKSWVILERTDGTNDFVVLAGTEDKKAINAALASLKLYKDECTRDGREDLTIIRQAVAEDLAPINQVLSQDQEDETDRLMSMVELDNEQKTN